MTGCCADDHIDRMALEMDYTNRQLQFTGIINFSLQRFCSLCTFDAFPFATTTNTEFIFVITAETKIFKKDFRTFKHVVYLVSHHYNGRTADKYVPLDCILIAVMLEMIANMLI